MGAVFYTCISPSLHSHFCLEAVGRNSQMFSCHCRQIRYKLEDLKDAQRPSQPSLYSSLTHFLLVPELSTFSHMHPQLNL